MLRISLRAAETAKQRLAQALAFSALLAGTAALASPVTRDASFAAAKVGVAQMGQKLDLRGSMFPPAQAMKLVWEGADVDGDGQADFANPTGRQPRGEDAYGEGEFGASRDGGVRRHEGVDFTAIAGQTVVAPISGYVTKIGFAYAGDPDLKFVEITNPALNVAARVFYVNPAVAVGDTVAVGRAIGRMHTLQQKYPGGMTDHVHLEILEQGHRVDAAQVIVARYEPAGQVQAGD